MKAKAFFLSVLIFLLFPFAAHTAITLDVNLEQMTQKAVYIFSGVCTDVTQTTDDQTGREVYFFTFRVDQMIKGESRDEFRLKTSRTLVDMGKVPVYDVGEEVVLFLYGESEFGFSSPVGLSQGRFNVKTQADGSRVVVNGRGNRGLFKGMQQENINAMFRTDATAQKTTVREEGPIDYRLFMDMVQGLK